MVGIGWEVSWALLIGVALILLTVVLVGVGQEARQRRGVQNDDERGDMSMRTFALLTPERPECCCATCRWWVVGTVGPVWCRIRRRELPEPLTAGVCLAYDQELHETDAVTRYARLQRDSP
jgi:hypothetical protein